MANVLSSVTEKEFFIDNLLVRIQFIIVRIRWTGPRKVDIRLLGNREFKLPWRKAGLL